VGLSSAPQHRMLHNGFMIGLQVHETIVALTELERTRKREVRTEPSAECVLPREFRRQA
jgi:hypothetical protein